MELKIIISVAVIVWILWSEYRLVKIAEELKLVSMVMGIHISSTLRDKIDLEKEIEELKERLNGNSNTDNAN